MNGDLPTFFFSHSRQERVNSRSRYLDTFFDDLEKNLAEIAGVALDDKTRLGTIDRRDVAQGDDWDADLTKALRTSCAFVAIFSPLFFSRANIGKELYIFLTRSSDLKVDSNGALKGVRNILPVQWQPGWVYDTSDEKRGRIPKILRLLNDVPPDRGQDKATSEAIEQYKLVGMKNCVASEPHYSRLLDIFARALRDMKKLPDAADCSFAAAEDAFACDWGARLEQKAATGPSPEPGPEIGPQPLSSLVVFHLTNKSFAHDAQMAISNGNQVRAVDTSTDLLADIWAAAATENINVFNTADMNGVAESADRIVERLKTLGQKGVLTALACDGDLWAGADANLAKTIDEIVNSTEWFGPVFVSDLGVALSQGGGLDTRRESARTIAVLPTDSTQRIPVIQRAIIDARGNALRSVNQVASNAERLPILAGVGGSGA